MSSQNPNEIWQVEVSGQIYEAAFAELGNWIGDGALHPGDKVRRGNLRWIEARRVPSLMPFFNAKERGEPMPVVVSTTDAPEPVVNISAEPAVTEAAFEPVISAESPSFVNAFTAPVSDPIQHAIAAPFESHGKPDPNFCAMHTDLASVYLCDGCGSGLCKVCPKSYSSVRICPLCGAMCRMLNEVVQKRSETAWRSSAIAEGFGASDFFNALAHPFKFKVSLFFGALMFMFFTLGQSVTAIGGIYMFAAAIFSTMLANMLTFGILSNTIESFAHGKLESNFMPDFEDFELWDSVIHPFFLSIGAYLSAFGPFFLVLIIGFYVVYSSVSSQMDAFHQDMQKIPGTHTYDSNRALDQSEVVKGVIGDVNRAQAERLNELNALNESLVEDEETAGEVVEEDPSRRESREQEELWEMAQQQRAKSLEAAIGKSPETEEKEREAMVQNFLSLAPPLVVIGAIFFLWGLFYFPAACAVAGYTRTFGATINPLVGLDTIKRLGGTYVSILFMGLVLLIASVVVGGIVGIIFAAFNLPGLGNLPAKAIGALFSFYLWTVFSCILGYAIFKKSDVLQIQT